MFADQVHDAPAAIALLNMRERERRHFRSAQAAAQQHGNDGTIAETAQRRHIGRVEQRLRLARRQPVPGSDADALALFTRAIPAASSGASRPLSAASAASFRIADVLMMIDDDPIWRSTLEFLRSHSPWSREPYLMWNIRAGLHLYALV